tara:strand:+ start:2168 stop:4288 length:2121 start_codon:yes stop_codon:yes gene_type:complete
MVGRRLRAWIERSAISLFVIPIAASLLAISSLRSTADAFQPLEAIQTALGATYGTILALVLTLSFVPIQRAAEAWTSSIVRLYRSDRLTHVTFIVLGVLCAVSFLFAVRGLGDIPVSIVLAFSLVTLGISLDILRLYHGHICELLDPIYAVNLALKQAKQVIDRTNALVARLALHQYQLLSDEDKIRFTVEDLQPVFYPNTPGYPDSINSRINDLAEIGGKAVARGEKLLARTAIAAIAELTIHYLTSRRHNLSLTPAPDEMFLATTSDVNVVTDRAYQELGNLSHAAVAQDDESTAIRVSVAYQNIAIHTANLGARAFRENDAPLTFAPIYYALESVKYARTKGLDEVVFQSATILARVATNVPTDTDNANVHIPIIDGLAEIAVYFYAKQNLSLAEEVNGDQFAILAHLLDRQDFYFKDMLGHVLEKMELLAPLAITNEKIAARLTLVYPLGKAYGLVNRQSLGYLFSTAAETLPEIVEEREWVNPYRELIEIAGIISRHLRSIAENNEFGNSFLIWEIDQLIKHIAVVISRIVDEPVRPDHHDEDELVDKLHWITAFYWVAFRRKKTVDGNRADECCESLGYIGLLFFSREYPDVLRLCISNIRSILDSYCEIAARPDDYTIGDMLAHLWGIRLLLVERENLALIRIVDEALDAKPTGLSDTQWQDAQEAILLRRQQLERSLEQEDDGLRIDDYEALLRRMLR